MGRFALLALLGLLALPARAEIVVAAGTIRSLTVIGPGDVALAEGTAPGALSRLEDAIGREARVNLYPGRPIHATDLRAPAVIGRNEVVTLQFESNGLLIVTDARALDRGGVGDRLRVLNLGSRSTVTGTVLGPGLVAVGRSNGGTAP